ncbi:hypothetical protein LEMLEM_LOCUS7830, partial [Lemmus lemmus]
GWGLSSRLLHSVAVIAALPLLPSLREGQRERDTVAGECKMSHLEYNRTYPSHDCSKWLYAQEQMQCLVTYPTGKH